jgi:hypothetical protein
VYYILSTKDQFAYFVISSLIMLRTLPAGSHGQERGHDGRDKCEDLNGFIDKLLPKPED